MPKVRSDAAAGVHGNKGPVRALGDGDTVLRSEHEEQRELVSWFRKSFPEMRIFAIPNGGARSIVTASKMKVEGVSAGVPDLYVPALKLWIEMKKVRGGTVDPKQKDWHDYLVGIGDAVIVGKGADDAKRQILSFMGIKIP